MVRMSVFFANHQRALRMNPQEFVKTETEKRGKVSVEVPIAGEKRSPDDF